MYLLRVELQLDTVLIRFVNSEQAVVYIHKLADCRINEIIHLGELFLCKALCKSDILCGIGSYEGNGIICARYCLLYDMRSFKLVDYARTERSEVITYKSDDRLGRRKVSEAIIKGIPLPEPGIPEAFKVLVKELSALCLDVKLYDDKHNIIDTDALALEDQKEERKINSALRDLTGESIERDTDVLITDQDELSAALEEIRGGND